QWNHRLGAAGEETAGGGLAARGIAEAVVGFRAPPGRRAVEAPHGGLHGDAGGLVQGAEDDGGEGSVDLLVDDPERQRLRAPWAAFGATEVVEGPAGLVEAHLQLLCSAEGAADQHLVPGRYGRVVGIGSADPGVPKDPVGCPVVADEEPEGEGGSGDVLIAADQFGGSQDVGETLRLLQAQHSEREPAPGRDALALAPQAIEEGGGEDEEEIGLGLPAARGEPEGVDDPALHISEI